MKVRHGLPLLALMGLIACEVEMAEQSSGQPDGRELQALDEDVVRAFTRLATAPDLETRTFALAHLSESAAVALITPYVYGDRPGAPGTFNYAASALSVRETPDNLDKIARMLGEFDVATKPPSYRLHFQVVAANGDESTDPRLAPVEAELRKVFRFDGYSLVGEGFVTVSTGGFDLSITPDGEPDFYHVDGTIYGTTVLSLAIKGPSIPNAAGMSTGGQVRTRLGFRPGQTLVLGSMPAPDKTVFIVVHVAEVNGDPV